jgi:hypothetical protein
MEPDGTKSQLQFPAYFRWGGWALGVLLLLLTLAGCLTSYAAGPPEHEGEPTPTGTLPLAGAEVSPTASATKMPAVTLVPNMAVRAFQVTTTTATATVTPTATATVTPIPIPDTPTPTLEPTDTPEPTNTPGPTAIPATPAPFQAYAWVDNYFPAPGSIVTVYGRLFKNGRPVNGAQMGVTWSYTHAQGYCSAYTGKDGLAACAQNIGAPLQNYWVYLDVVFIHEDAKYYAKTGFVTDP